MPKTKQKTDKKTKTSIAKTKPKKGKPAKVPKTKKKSASPKNKKILMLLVAALILIILGAAAAIILLTMPNKRVTRIAKEETPKAPAYYFSKKEDISSITKIVGTRNFQKLTSTPKSSESEDDSAQEAEETSQEEVYQYSQIEDVSGDLKSYLEYLEGDKNFIDVTQKEQQAPDSSKESSSEEQNEFYQFAGPSNDSESYLFVTLESKDDSYTVITSQGNEPWNTYFKDLWGKQQKTIEEFQKQPKATNTIAQAENTVRAQGQKKLGLPEKADSYEYIAAPGLSQIDGKEFYTVRTYKRQPDNTLIYIATYLYDYKTSQVSYAFDEISRKYTPLG